MKKSYTELMMLPTFEERFEYLSDPSLIGIETFGSSRYLNQAFYTSKVWRQFRNDIILRDNGCDLAVSDRPIYGKIILHHINPVTEDHIVHADELLMDPENLVCVSLLTHNAIHFGDSSILYEEPVERYPNDTCPWKGGRL